MKKNIYLFYMISFLETFVFTTAIWSFFFTSYLHFSFGQALFLITIVGIISVIFEVPSGAWADRFGRKKMYILGTSLLIINLIFWCFATNFLSFIIAGIIAGLGNAIVSGNLEALVHDELEENNNEKQFKNIASNSYILIFFGRAISSAFAGIIFILNPLYPIYLTLFSTILILIFAMFLKEPKQFLSKHKDNFSHLKESISFLIKNKFILIFMIILGLLSGMGNIYYFTQQPYFKQLSISIENIGLIYCLGAISSAFGTYIFKKISNFFNEKQILNIILIMTFFSSILFALFIKIYAIFGIVILSIMFGFIMTFGNNYLIHKVPKNQKSTILSVFSLIITIGYSFFNIILSINNNIIGLNIIYIFNVFLILCLIIFNLFTFNKHDNLAN